GRIPSFNAAVNATNVVLTALVDGTDLAVESVVAPGNAEPGDVVSIPYTVRNLSTAPALGSWVDSLYLSSDTALDPGDKRVGRVTHAGDVAGLGSYNETLTAPLPDVVPGAYHVLLLVDSRGFVPDIDRSNNVGAAVGSVNPMVETLPVGGTVSGTLAD